MPDAPQRGLDRLLAEFEKFDQWLAIGTPWITDGAKAWVEANLRSDDCVLEFGAGRSSVYWAKRAAKATIVEASPDWTIWLLLHLYKNPQLLKRVRVHFCPAEWNPDFNRGVKRYWTENRSALTDADIVTLERDLITVNFPGNNIVLFDGSVRDAVFLYQVATMNLSEIEVIIIDNCEIVGTSEIAAALIPLEFERLDFVAGSTDDIPVHQKGKHITSIFVKRERLNNSISIKTETPTKLSRQERRPYFMHKDIFDAPSHIAGMVLSMNKRLGLDVSPKLYHRD